MTADDSHLDLIHKSIQSLHARYRDCDEGKVATYIPELAKADPSWFGIAVADVHGNVIAHGDCDVEFTIQSISKAFIFGMALEEHGRDDVLKHVGVEPSGDSFNSIELQGDSRPHNAMINAGAIVSTSLIPGKDSNAKVERILETLSILAGRQLRVDETVYRSESDTGHRNRAIAYMLRNVNLLGQDLDEVLDAYFRQCSILVTARDLAMMGASLANLGRNPVTGREAMDLYAVRDVLSVMFTCGMYDFAGSWAFRVGVPAKSGVSGGILAVVNRQLGLSVFSPRLDPMGNSVRGIRVSTDLADQFGLHVFNFTNMGSTFLHAIKPNAKS
jgi:glutaminase